MVVSPFCRHKSGTKHSAPCCKAALFSDCELKGGEELSVRAKSADTRLVDEMYVSKVVGFNEGPATGALLIHFETKQLCTC